MGTGVLMLLGGEVENRYVRRSPTSVLGYWGGNVQTPVCKRTRHPDFPPKLATNSVFKPKPDVSCCACACHLTLISRQKYFEVFSHLKLAGHGQCCGYVRV